LAGKKAARAVNFRSLPQPRAPDEDRHQRHVELAQDPPKDAEDDHHLQVVGRARDAADNWRNELFGLTSEPAVMVYHRALVPAAEAAASRFDLLRRSNRRYDGKIATYDIEASGLGYLFAFADAEQTTTFGSLIEAFGRRHTQATCCSAEIIAGVESGRWLIAYNVLGSNTLARADVDPNLAVVVPQDRTLVLQRAGLIPKEARAAIF